MRFWVHYKLFCGVGILLVEEGRRFGGIWCVPSSLEMRFGPLSFAVLELGSYHEVSWLLVLRVGSLWVTCVEEYVLCSRSIWLIRLTWCVCSTSFNDKSVLPLWCELRLVMRGSVVLELILGVLKVQFWSGFQSKWFLMHLVLLVLESLNFWQMRKTGGILLHLHFCWSWRIKAWSLRPCIH